MAPRQDIADTIHGVRVEDPYRWLEKMESPETLAWIRAQDTHTRKSLEALPHRDAILRRIEALHSSERAYPAAKRGQVYYQVRSTVTESERHWGLYAIKGVDSSPRLLIDYRSLGDGFIPATLRGTGMPAFDVSLDGRYLALGARRPASPWSEWRIYDTKAGELLDDRIVGIHRNFGQVLWNATSSGFYYASYPVVGDPDRLDATALRDHRVRFHTVGSTGPDPAIYADPNARDAALWLEITTDRAYLVIKTITDHSTVVRALNTADGTSTTLDSALSATLQLVGGRGSRLWFRDTRTDVTGALVEIDVTKPEVEREIVPAIADKTMTGAVFFGGRFLLQYTHDALPQLQVHSSTGRFERTVELPYIGWVRGGFLGTPGDSEVLFMLQGTGEPNTVYRLDLETGTSAVFWTATPAFDRDNFVSEQVFFASRDGTRVPMTLVYRRGLDRSQPRATWLYAYGANWAAVPWYSVNFRVWLEMGGVYALVNVRGGSEYGETWRRAGSGVHKQNGIDDYIAAAKHLIKTGWTSPTTLVANGGSASGPLAAAAVLQRPDLFAVGAISYPILDLLRYHLFAAGQTAGNWGTAENLDEFTALRRYSPVHNTKPGRCYPPMIIAQGEKDQAAAPFHSYKFAAALQHAQGCDNPIYLQVGWDAGHTVGGPEDFANQVAFLADLTGLEAPTDW